jgi:acyl-CoA thioesterase-2
MNPSLTELINDNALEKLDVYLFRGKASHDSGGRIYGGQVMAQAISAAQQSVDGGFILHSFHSYFLRPGDPSLPVIYEVDPIRDGRSFVTRRIVAKQKGRAIFNCSTSFQLPEEGLDHQADMPKVLGPDQLATDEELYKVIFPDSDYGWPVEFRQVDPVDLVNPSPKSAVSYTWFKTADKIDDNIFLHQQLLAYASDNPILLTAFRPHGYTAFTPGLMSATLDHALWFHRPFRVDEWLLFETHSDSVCGSRGISRGKIFNQQGDMVASAIQEGLMRKVKT